MTKKITTLLVMITCFGFYTKAQINLQNGLIAYFTLDNTLLDSTANNLDLFAGGNPGPTTDRFNMPNGSYNLTNTNPDYFTGSSDAIMSPAELTLSAWVKLADPFDDQKVAGKTSVGPGYLMGIDSNKIDAEIWDATNFQMRIKGGNIIANTWTQLAISYKANGYLKIYIDGMALDSMAASANGVGTNAFTPFTIGAAPWDNFALNLGGAIDDVCLYNRELNAAEIMALYSMVPTFLNQAENDLFTFNVYPNPVVNGLTTLRFNKFQEEPIQITITDVLGKVVYTQQNNGLSSININLSENTNGVYFLHLTNQKGLLKSQKMVLSKN